MEKVILVDKEDNPTGEMEKIQAHKEGLLHRAFSIFIFNQKGEMLLQKRAEGKYHSAGLWSNACCSHPAPGEAMEAALKRKLQQEMGFSCPLQKAFEFTYKAEFKNGLTEHEYDHVYLGVYEDEINPNPNEVSDYRFVTEDELNTEIIEDPERFTEWFRILYMKVLDLYARPE